MWTGAAAFQRGRPCAASSSSFAAVAIRLRVSGSVTTTIRRPWENPALGAQTTAASAIRSSTSFGTVLSAYVRTLRRRVRTSRNSTEARSDPDQDGARRLRLEMSLLDLLGDPVLDPAETDSVCRAPGVRLRGRPVGVRADVRPQEAEPALEKPDEEQRHEDDERDPAGVDHEQAHRQGEDDDRRDGARPEERLLHGRAERRLRRHPLEGPGSAVRRANCTCHRRRAYSYER